MKISDLMYTLAEVKPQHRNKTEFDFRGMMLTAKKWFRLVVPGRTLIMRITICSTQLLLLRVCQMGK